jgi:hypothetical protein
VTAKARSSTPRRPTSRTSSGSRGRGAIDGYLGALGASERVVLEALRAVIRGEG